MALKVSETRLTQSQLSGLRVELNEITQENNSQSEEEAGSSTEGTENELEQRLNEPSSLEGNSPTADGIDRQDETDSACNARPSSVEHTKKESADPSVKDETSEDHSSEATTKCESLNQDGDDSRVENLSERTYETEPDINRTSTDDNISLKIKFLNETERIIRTSIEETVGNFKRLNFAEESQDGRVVHLIFNGQFLRDDSRQLGSYSIVNNCVLHCHISQHQQSPGTAAQQSEQGELDIGQFMVPLFACTIGFVWYLRWQYSYMFNNVNHVLSAVTVLFMLAVLLRAWRG
ncbi:putative transmembrane and ubiquitin-like domain-containing protein 1 [Apostichopus japonicus]|uniref:Putative transmembrane and ubiquitin-like domain-containing protein 1 n=1 Tax=Stichopus japonicus TaxID=307972 RepID=A0A2G8L5Y8_STIJA|nr:putative transmembrane and ubiquitin-like domain-containing protein 1 [Apostichopus japonicus]